MIKHIIMVKGAVETLEYFSMQMAHTFQKQGIDVWFWDMKAPVFSREQLEKRKNYQDTIFLTFNFIGLSEESQFQWEEQSLWEHFGIPCCCIMVDHPMYYYKQLMSEIKNLTIFCIDREHKQFVEEFYPAYGKVRFLPLGGTKISVPEGRRIPFSDKKRDIDVVFTGNYVPIEKLMPHIQHMDQENRDFFFSIIEELIAHPDRSLNEELLGRLRGEIPEITREETLACMYSMTFIDLYVRSYFRREIVCSLAEHDIPVLTVGKDWELAGCKKPENIKMTGQLNSLGCLRYMQRSKIAVNIMPWFKDGAHDRIFNAMLQGCVTVTDSSRYLDEVLTEGKDFVGFTLEERENISDKIKYLFAHPKEAEEIAERGYQTAVAGHTWEVRALEILKGEV